MFHIVLFEPEIPPNTGNIIRLAANTGCQLHLIKPLGFELQDKLLRRAGLDYHEWADVKQYNCLQDYLELADFNRLFAFSTKAKSLYTEARYQSGDALLFGPETRGLPTEVREQFETTLLKLPMRAQSRSLNLSNSVAVVVYEAWRQLNFIEG